MDYHLGDYKFVNCYFLYYISCFAFLISALLDGAASNDLYAAPCTQDGARFRGR